jgi:hypothetical protein
MQPIAIDPNAILRTKNLIDDLLDREYFKTVGKTLDAIKIGSDSGALGRTLSALEIEAARLSEAGLQLTDENAVMRVFRSDLDDFLRANTVLIDGSAEALQNVGVSTANTVTRQLAFGNASDDVLQSFGVTWNRVDPEAIQSIIQYVDSDAWAESLSGYNGYINDVVDKTVKRGFIQGLSPSVIVDDLVDLMRGVGPKPPLTVSSAESITRSLFQTAHRDSQALHQVANADIIEKVIRIAALDVRTCLSCISLHGTEIPLGERVDDHRRGRCTSITIVKGRPRTIESGEHWFNRQSDVRQKQIAGGANYNALKDGRVTLTDFIKKGKDPIFGDIVQENSLKGILGKDAQQFYTRNYGKPRPSPRRNDLIPSGVTRNQKPTINMDTPEAIAWEKSLSVKERQALRDWSAGGYKDFRRIATGDIDGISKTRIESYEHFVSAMNRAPDTAGVKWRGIGIKGQEWDSVLNSYKTRVGTTETWNTWASVSSDAGVGGYFTVDQGTPVLFEMYGTKSGNMNRSSTFHGGPLDEFESITQPNSSFTILNAYPGKVETTFGIKDVIIVQLRGQ